MSSVRDFWARAALAISVLTPLYFVAVALAVKFGLVDWRFGFATLTLAWGPLLIVFAAGFALVGLVLALLAPPRRGRRISLAAVLIPAVMLGYGVVLRAQAVTIAPIHDISTDLADPPAFSEAVVAARGRVAGGNDLELSGARIPVNARFGDWAGRSVVEVAREAYSDITPIESAASRERAFAAALESARAQGWTIGRVDAEAGTIEAQAESFWFGFVDDVAIRVRASGAGSRVDVRSVSRVGVSDLGANAARVRAFLADLRARSAAAES